MREHSEWPEIAARHLLKVRYAETDQMGVVYHANYLVWFHEARDALLAAQRVDIARLEREGYRFPLVDLSCSYLSPARYGDAIEVCAWLLCEPVARLRFRFEARQARSGRLLATGRSVSVVTDRYQRLLLRLPPELACCLSGDAAGRAAPPDSEGTLR